MIFYKTFFKNTIYFVIVLIFFSCQNSEKNFLNEGKKLIKQNKPEQAIDYFNKVIQQNANNAEAFNLRGVAYFNLQDYTNSLQDYSKAIQLNEKNYKPYNNRAILYLAMQKPDSALEDYNKAIILSPDTASLYTYRGFLYYQTNKIKEAKKDFEKSLLLNPKDKEALFNQANILFSEQSFDKAKINFQKIISLDKDFARAYYGLGLSEFYLKNKKNACQYLEKAKKMNVPDAEIAFKKYCEK